jgi:hypothetical protein
MPLGRSSDSDEQLSPASSRSRAVKFASSPRVTIEDAFERLFAPEEDKWQVRSDHADFLRRRRAAVESDRKELEDTRFTGKEEAIINNHRFSEPIMTLSTDKISPSEAEADMLVANITSANARKRNMCETEKRAIAVFTAYAARDGKATDIGFHRFIRLVRDASTVGTAFPERDILSAFVRNSKFATGLADFDNFVVAVSELAVTDGRPMRHGIMSIVALYETDS